MSSRNVPHLVRLGAAAGGVCLALSAAGLYGAAGAWADQDTRGGNGANTGAALSVAGAGGPQSSQSKQGSNGAGDEAGDKAGDKAPPGIEKQAASPHQDNGKGNDNRDSEAAATAPESPAAPVLGPSVTVVGPVAPVASADSSRGRSASAPGHADDGTPAGQAADHGNDQSGSLTGPQPPSHADQTPGGANNGGDCGDYCSTRDGKASGNGNGNGQAVGKPCAGCVGKADNKNPPGQFKNGSDHNNGYECDGNHGIGRTNPAHTGCRPGATSGGTTGGSSTGGHTTGATTTGGSSTGGHSTGGTTTGGSSTGGHTTGDTTGGDTTGGDTSGTTGDTTGGSSGITTGTTTGAESTGGAGGGGGSTNGTSGTSGGASTGAAQGCPPAGTVGPVPAGCVSSPTTALPFTGFDPTGLIGLALVLAGLGLGLQATSMSLALRAPRLT